MKFFKLFLAIFLFSLALISLSPKAFAATIPLSVDTSTLDQAKFTWSLSANPGLYVWRAADTTHACQDVNNTFWANNSVSSPQIVHGQPGDYVARLNMYGAGWISNCVSFSINEPPQSPGAGGLTGILGPEGFKITSLGDLVSGIYPIILGIAGFMLVIFIIFSGLQIIFSSGDPKALAGARQRLIFAVVGFVVILGAFAITVVIQNILGLKIF